MQSIIAQSLFFEKVTGKTINPVTQIHGIAKDSAGYIWFGSWNGAYRYDGGSFDLYRHISGDSASLPNNRIRNIVTDQHQGLWLLTFDHKYVRFDYNYGRFRIIPDSLVSDYVANLLNSTSNRINRNSIIDGKRYILSSHHLAALDVRTGQTRQYRTNFSQPGGLEDDYVTCFYIDNQQIIWIGTRSGDIYKANTNRKPFDLHYCHQREEKDFRLLSARVVMKLSGELWIGTNSGILIYDQQGFIKNHPFYNSGSNIRQIRSLRQDAGGNIWIGGIDGLECYYPGSAKIETYISQSKHPELEIRSVFTISRSRSNYIWAGLYNGLARIRLADHHIDFFDLSELVNDHSIMDIVLDKSKHIWLATEGNGVIRLSLEKQNGFSHPLLFNTTLPDRTHRLAGDMVYSLY
ncbi:MAG TPA: two-component regulator propeller domain-containing protein, partial [Bacteroidales bacterium]|nr:two-component regulator propeller domain-containing protein [Bacteroidales bacterium]